MEVIYVFAAILLHCSILLVLSYYQNNNSVIITYVARGVEFVPRRACKRKAAGGLT